MRLRSPKQHALFGQGHSVINVVTLTAGCGMLLLGYDQGVMAGLIGGPGTPFTLTFNDPSAAMLGLMVAIYEIGCFLGAVFVFLAGEASGRRLCMIGGTSVMVIGATVQTASMNMTQLIVGRIVTGIGNGINFSTIPVWASEMSGFEERGKVAAFNGWLIVWGVVIAYWVDYGCANYQTDVQFRLPIALQMVFGIIMALFVLVLPESPRWLVSEGRNEEAKAVLHWITPKPSGSISNYEDTINESYDRIVQTREIEMASDGDFSYTELFGGGKMQNWRRVTICFGVMAFQQLSGINVLTYYISYVLEHSVSLSHHSSLLIGGFNGMEYLLAALIPIWTIEKFGRRNLLLISATGQMISMMILSGAIWYVTERPGTAGSFTMGIVAVVCFFLFNTFYAQGFLAIPFFYPAEISNLRTRSRAVSISVMSNWLFTFLVVMITPVATTNIGWRTYVIFAVLNATFIPIIYFFFPETAGLSLEALDSLFDYGGVTRGVLSKQHRHRMLELSSFALDTSEGLGDGEAKQDSSNHVEYTE